MEFWVASKIEHNRFSIVRVCQASEDIQFPYIALIGDVIQLDFLKIVYLSLLFNNKCYHGLYEENYRITC